MLNVTSNAKRTHPPESERNLSFRLASHVSPLLVLLLASVLMRCNGNPTADSGASSGEFTLLTYNVAGLPAGISASDPEKNIPLISPLLNKFDIVLVQEDFFYHDELRRDTNHRFRSQPKAASSQFTTGDGLNRFSNFSFGAMTRDAWQACSNESGNDCLAQKGFSVAETELAAGVVVDVYNLHLDAGGSQQDMEARTAQVSQLLQALQTRSPNKAVILAGDFNLDVLSRPQDAQLFQHLLTGGNLTDACHALSCARELVDRVLFRSSSRVTLQPISWSLDGDFVDGQGKSLSDHNAVSVEFRWELN